MKTVILNSDKRSIILVEDSVSITIHTNHIKKNNEFIYGLYKDKVSLYENVEAPEDWRAGKYTYDGTSWSLNSNWVDPSTLTH